jgi:hypothetical protein
MQNTSVMDLGCISRIPDPDFYPSRFPDQEPRIPDPKTATKERGEKKLVVVKPFIVATNFTKLKEKKFLMLKNKIWAIFKEL